MEQVLAALMPDEPDYGQAAQLGPEALPHLATLVSGTDALLASKAAYLASLIQDRRSASVLRQAAASPNTTVRVAAAAGVANLAGRGTAQVLTSLLSDADPGVRRIALDAVPPAVTPALRGVLRNLAETDPDQGIRRRSSELLRQGGE
jgi:HEAT repeat protein